MGRASRAKAQQAAVDVAMSLQDVRALQQAIKDCERAQQQAELAALEAKAAVLKAWTARADLIEALKGRYPAFRPETTDYELDATASTWRVRPRA